MQPTPISNRQQVIDLVESLDVFERAGVIVFSPLQVFKVINERYHQLATLRGNTSNILFRYLELRQEEDDKIAYSDRTMEDFRSLYSEHSNLFNETEQLLNETAIYIHRKYLERHVSKIYNRVTPQENTVLSNCHFAYIKSRNPVTVEIVKAEIDKQSVALLYSLVKSARARQ